MTAFPYRRSLLALALAACGATAHAQQDCRQQIGQLERQIQQQQMNQHRQMEMRELLQAARQNPGECTAYMARARQMMRQGTQTPTGEPSVPTGETAIVPTGEPSSTVTRSRQESVAPPASTAEPAPAPVPEERVARQPAQSRPAPQDDTLDVQVDQAPAQVDVQTRSPQVVVKQQPAEVTVEQKPPQVEITQHEPKVEVEQPKPEVRVNRAQPDVKVTQSEPQVEVRQPEPEVRVVQPESTAQVRTEREGRPLAGEQGSGASDLNLQDVRGRQALSSEGEEIGEIQGFVRSTTDGSAHALIAVGGVLGIGERTIAVPLDRVQIGENGTLQTQLSQEALEAQPEYDEQRYRAIPETEFAALEAELESQDDRPQPQQRP